MIRVIWLVWLLSLPAFGFAQEPQEPVYVEVVAGNVAALGQAIEDANRRPIEQKTVILVDGKFSFSANDSLPAIEGNITIQGHPGPGIFQGLQGDGQGPQQLFLVAANASLGLLNIELKDFSLGHSGPGLIENLGKLDMRRLQLSDVRANQFCGSKVCNHVMPAIANRPSGQVDMNQVSIIDSGITRTFLDSAGGLISNEGRLVLFNTQLYLSEASWDPPISTSGSVLIVNSSFKYARLAGSASLDFIRNSQSGAAQIANSVFAGFSGEWCSQATSSGYNLIDAPDCGWSAEGDLVGVPAGLLWRPVEGRWSSSFRPEILTYGLVPVAASAAVDSGSADWCQPLSLTDYRTILDGNADGLAACDRGAVEISPVGLAEGGINGLYFDPEADGHYVYILESDFNTLVVWNTFDPDRQPVWVYGIGQLTNGRSLVAEAWINRNGRVSLDGDIEAAQDEHWGTLNVQMDSCTEGLVGFQSDLPEFGSGQFQIKRLAFAKHLGCTDL